jgi:hypothetical protein
MTRALSQDLRSRVIAAVDDGISCNAAAGPDSGTGLPTASHSFTRRSSHCPTVKASRRAAAVTRAQSPAL